MNGLFEQYDEVWEMRDRRADDWPLMNSPLPTMLLCISYVVVVKFVGPTVMKNRKPFNLRWLLILYNLTQVLLSAWLSFEFSRVYWQYGYSLRCQPIDNTNNPRVVRLMYAGWWFYFSKFIDFLDTIFFLLRKKQEQISGLHVFHHGYMPISIFLFFRFAPGGHGAMIAFLNTIVHTVMYFYYMVAAMGSQYQKYLWWKKYLTKLQMVQFVLTVYHCFKLLFIDCNYPHFFVWLLGGQAIFFFALFMNFYRSAYIQRAANQKIKDS